MEKTGRKLAPWVEKLVDLEPEYYYSFLEIAHIFEISIDAAEGQLRKLNIKASYYKKVGKFSRRAYFLGQDIISKFKKRKAKESNSNVRKFYTALNKKYKSDHALEIKVDILYNEILKTNPDFKSLLLDEIRRLNEDAKHKSIMSIQK